MSTPSNPIQAAIFARLSGFDGLADLIGDGQVFDFVPDDTEPPYVLIGDDTSVDDSTKTEGGWDMTLTVHAWDFEKAGRKSVKAILSAIYDALHRREGAFSLDGFTVDFIACEFEQTFRDASEEGQNDRFYHGVQRYRVLIAATTDSPSSAPALLLKSGGHLLLKSGGKLLLKAS